jgi:hypothetical protein
MDHSLVRFVRPQPFMPKDTRIIAIARANQRANASGECAGASGSAGQ